MNDRWDVRHSLYLPYAEVLTLGGGDLNAGMEKTKQETVARNLPFKEAKEMVDRFGFGYSMHPA